MKEAFRFAPPYELPTYPFVPPEDLRSGPPRRYPIVIVGAGPAGLTLACDLAQRGVASVLIDEDDTVGVRGASSRGICYAQKSLEILDRMQIGERAVAKGVAWSLGRTLSGNEEVYNFNLQTQSVSEQPPFVNLQQFYLEWFLVDRIQELGLTDVRFAKPLPVERWTWVDAPFNEGRAVWQHLMPDHVWRMDYQMPENADIGHITKPEVAVARLREQLGPDVEFEFVWIGPYQYRDHLLDDFRHGRIFFIGDAALP